MKDFDALLTEAIEYLNGLDDYGANYYLNMLQQKSFLDYIRFLYEHQEYRELSDFWENVVSTGYKMSDIQNVFDIVVTKNYTPPIAPFSVSNESKTDANLSAHPIEEKSNNAYLSEYYFSLCYKVSERTGNESEEYIEIASNLFSVSEVLQKTISQLGLPISEVADQFFLSETAFDKDYFAEYGYLHFITNTLARLSDSETRIIRATNSFSLNDLFDFLQFFFRSIYDNVDVENTFVKIRSVISQFSEKAKQIPLKRIVIDKEVISILNNENCSLLNDLLIVTPKSLKPDQATELYKTVECFDTDVPQVVLQNILNTLQPREIAIIRKRYLDGNGATLEAVGACYSLTRERVRQLESKAARKLAHPSKKKLKQQLIALLKLYGKYENFFTQDDIDVLGLPENSGIFFDKVLHIVSWNASEKIAFYNAKLESKIDKAIEELPNECPISDLDEYAALIAEENKNVISADEIKNLAVRKYRKYGTYIVRGRMTTRVAFSYLLNTYFPNGLDIYNEDNIDFLRQKAREDFDGYELAESNRAVQARMQSFCTLIGRGIWKLDTNNIAIPKDLRDIILLYIDEYKSPVIPIQTVWDYFAKELSDVEITNKYYLQGQLKKILPNRVSVNRDYIIKDSGDSFYTILEAFVKEANSIVTKADFQKNFPGISDIVIQQAAANTKILNMNGYYVHLDNLHISREEKSTFKESVDEIITTSSIYHAKAIFNSIRRKNVGLFSRIGISHYLQFYYLLKELFPDDYSYYRPFVGKPGVEMMSGEAQVLDRMARSPEVTIADIREYARSVGTMIDRYIEFVDRNNDSFIFKNRTTVITLDAAGIDDSMFDELDVILSDFLGDLDYRSLQEFFDYWRLPTLNCAWNEWLLYSIIGKYSTLFKMAVSSNYLNEAVPIIVKQGFDETLIDFEAIGKANPEDDEEKEDLLDMLDIDDLE